MPCSGKLTVLFENPFWVGVFEVLDDGYLTASRVVFGAEPREVELLAFIHAHYHKLAFGKAVICEQMEDRHINPKRLQRLIQKEASQKGIGTKSQQAIKATQEEAKVVRKIQRRDRLEAAAERKFELKQQKKKEKHKGH